MASEPPRRSLTDFTATQGTYDFNAAAGQTVRYVSVVPRQLTETLTIANEKGEVVRGLLKGVHRAAGRYEDEWNGRDDGGRLLPDGPYSYFITLTAGGDSYRWDSSTKPRSERDGTVNLTVSARLDPYENSPLVFAYDFPSSARTSLQVSSALNFSDCVHPRGPALCLTDWEWTPPGPYSFAWSGTDQAGVSVSDKKFTYLFYRTSTWPQNVVLLYGTKPKLADAVFAPTSFRPSSGLQSLDFELSVHTGADAAVAVEFLNQASKSILRTIRLTRQTSGRKRVFWDGRSDTGMLVAPGAYTARITAADSIGNVVSLQAVTRVDY